MDELAVALLTCKLPLHNVKFRHKYLGAVSSPHAFSIAYAFSSRECRIAKMVVVILGIAALRRDVAGQRNCL